VHKNNREGIIFAFLTRNHSQLECKGWILASSWWESMLEWEGSFGHSWGVARTTEDRWGRRGLNTPSELNCNGSVPSRRPSSKICRTSANTITDRLTERTTEAPANDMQNLCGLQRCNSRLTEYLWMSLGLKDMVFMHLVRPTPLLESPNSTACPKLKFQNIKWI
jgi:hypothetical protein